MTLVARWARWFAVGLALAVVAAGVQASVARAADASAAVAGVAPTEDVGGGPGRVRSLDHHLAPTLAESARKPLDVRARLAGGASALRRSDQRSAATLAPDAAAIVPPVRASGIRLRGPPAISNPIA